MGYEVEKLSLGVLFVYFLMYVLIHFGIGHLHKISKEKLEEDVTEENKKQEKIVGYLFKWFPAIYVIFLMVMFYFG